MAGTSGRVVGAPAGQRGSAPRGLDDLAESLEQLRLERGSVSYAAIAAKIASDRRAAGASEAASRVARSTVYDAFRAGRARVNPDLIEEIVRALTDDDEVARAWRDRSILAMLEERDARTPEPSQPLPTLQPRASMPIAVLIVVAAFAINNLGGQFVADLGVPLFLDMVGTAIAALALGPWWGVAAAVSNNVLGSVLEGDPTTLWFTLVNVAGALIWGYGVRAWRLGETPLRFFMLNVLVGVSCSLVAVPILVLAFGGSTGHIGEDSLGALLGSLGAGLWAAVFSSNLVLSIIDKLISGYLGLIAVRLLARHAGIAPAFGAIPRADSDAAV